MTRWIALFRGINVGGNNILPMKALRTLLEEIGCKEVETYIQSGNVIFTHSLGNSASLSTRIGKAVFDGHGFEPKVLLLTFEEMSEIAKLNPFPEAEENPKSLHIYFLAEDPASAATDKMNEIKSDTEAFSLIGRVFFMHAPDGIGRSKLAAKAEKLLGVSATGRNWRTVTKILELA
jgi:uncharacterized protein (DUF1697 family)